MTRPAKLDIDSDYAHESHGRGVSATPWGDWERELIEVRDAAGTTCLNCVYLATGMLHMTSGGYTRPACGRRAPQSSDGAFPNLPRLRWCGEFEAMK